MPLTTSRRYSCYCEHSAFKVSSHSKAPQNALRSFCVRCIAERDKSPNITASSISLCPSIATVCPSSWMMSASYSQSNAPGLRTNIVRTPSSIVERPMVCRLSSRLLFSSHHQGIVSRDILDYDGVSFVIGGISGSFDDLKRNHSVGCTSPFGERLAYLTAFED